jgi:hypothetical protein
MKILSMNFQRNGVSGQPFYSIVYYDDFLLQKVIATFQVDYSEGEPDPSEDTKIIVESCRVVCHNEPSNGFRGDEVAEEIEDEWIKSGTKTYYDWMESINKS